MCDRDYSKFITRLSSYEDPPWPDCGLYTKSLAEAGFVYTGEQDIVFCYQCGISVHQWRGDDDPITRHKALNEDCIFLQKRLMELTNGITARNNCKDPREQETYVYIRGSGVIKKSEILVTNGYGVNDSRVANEFMCSEKNRLESFATCDINKTWPTTDRLARCGFYWSDQRNSVVCFCCDGEVQEWDTPDQDVQQKHRSVSTSCRFVNGLPCGNIELLSDEELDIGMGKLNFQEKDEDLPTPNVVVTTLPLPSPVATTTTTYRDYPSPHTNYGGRSESRTYAPPMAVPVCSVSLTSSEDNLFQNNINNNNYLKNQNTANYENSNIGNNNNYNMNSDYPQPQERSRAGTLPHSAQPPPLSQGQQHLQRSMTCPAVVQQPGVPPPAVVLGHVTLDLSNKSVRLKTFITYPRDSALKPEELAEAGFYYECRQDLVRCFKCNVMLGKWTPGDSAWEEHRKFSPNCDLVRQKFHGIPLPLQQQPYSPIPPDPTNPRYPMPQLGGMPPTNHFGAPLPYRPEQRFYNSPSRPPVPPLDHNPYFDGQREYTPPRQGYPPSASPSQTVSPLMMNASPVYSPYGPPAYGPQSSQTGSSSSSGPLMSPLSNLSPGYTGPTDPRMARQQSDGANPVRAFGNLGQVRVGGTPLYVLPENFQNPLVTAATPSDALLQRSGQLIYQEESGGVPPGHGYHGFERQQTSYDAPNLHFGEDEFSSKKGHPYSNKPVGGIGYYRQEGHEQAPRITQDRQTSLDEYQEDKKFCKICWERPVEITFAPCGHLVLCEPCSRNIVECPICRSEVTSSIRTYFYGN